MRRHLALSLFSLLVMAGFASDAFAQRQARITGKVIDSVTKKPIEGVKIKVEAVKDAGKTFKQTFDAKKDGTYAIFLLDGTIRYNFTWEAKGYTSYTDTMKLQLGEPNKQDVELAPAAAAVAVSTPVREENDPHLVLFNEGANLANEGKIPEAIAKIEAAVAGKPDLLAGYGALARLHFRQNNWNKAIENALKVVELDAEDADMNAILFEAYTKTGNKEKAAEYKGKAPANPTALFNEAAKLINSGKDSAAEPLLKEAIAANPSFANAYYELGMLYVRTSKSAEAKMNLEKYLELEPNGKDAATAKEMLKYVK